MIEPESAGPEAATPEPRPLRPVGLAVPNMGLDSARVLRTLPRLAETWGYDSIWVTDHLVGTRAYEGVYGAHWMEALTSLSHIAALTSTIRLGTGVLVLPYRDPVLAAKMLSTIDVLSGGRLDIGVGAGWSRTEFTALGVGDRYENRGQVSDEALEVMLSCLRAGTPEHQGPTFSVRHIEIQPPTIQRPHPPVWVGGTKGASLRRAARMADVWHPNDLTPRELLDTGRRLDDQAGRSVARSVRCNVTDDQLDGIADLVDDYLQVGATRVVLEFRGQDPDAVPIKAEKAASALFG